MAWLPGKPENFNQRTWSSWDHFLWGMVVLTVAVVGGAMVYFVLDIIYKGIK